MPLIRCRDCRREVSDGARQCPHCGLPSPGSSPVGGYIFMLIVMAVMLGFAVWFFRQVH